MRVAAVVLALGVLLVPEVAFAGPLEGNIGLIYKPVNPENIGVEAEAGPTGGLWSIGVLYQAQRFQGLTDRWVIPTRTTAWWRVRHELPNGDLVGGLVGVNWWPESADSSEPLPDPWRYVGPVLGVSYTIRSGPLWLRFSPNVTLSPDKRYRTGSWWRKSGIPWVEAGMELLPGLQFSARLSDTFAKLAWTFD